MKEYSVYAHMALDSARTIQANSLDEAVEKAKGLKIGDYIKILHDNNDNEFAIVGVIEQVSIGDRKWQ